MTKFKYSHLKKTAIVARMKGDYNFQVYYIFWGILPSKEKKMFAFRKLVFVRNKRDEKKAVATIWNELKPYLSRGIAVGVDDMRNETIECNIIGVEPVEEIPGAFKEYMKFYYED